MKKLLERGTERSSWWPVYKNSTLEREVSRSSGHPTLQKCWEHDFLARAAITPLERTSKFWVFPDCVLELQIGFPATLLACNGSNLNMIILTWHQCKIITLWSSISWFIHMHVPKYVKLNINITNSCIQAHIFSICTCMWWISHILNLDNTNGDQDMSFL